MHSLTVRDYSPARTHFLKAVLKGLTRSRKRLPCKYLYDKRGSELFDQICDLDEYYPTRTEKQIMSAGANEMAQALGPDCVVIELGSGSSLKTRILLDHLERPAGYVPVDISRQHLEESAARLSQRYPHLEVLPVSADFTKRFTLPKTNRPGRPVVYFPGSTIGNFSRQAANRFLQRLGNLVGPEGGVLIGVDLKKSRQRLWDAYNDAAGVTAEFNKNILRRINRELGADFDLKAFDHRAPYNARFGRVEMHLVSRQAQTVTLGSEQIDLDAGETICTEHSHKYSLDQFAQAAQQAGLHVEQVWTDSEQLFSVQYLTRAM